MAKERKPPSLSNQPSVCSFSLKVACSGISLILILFSGLDPNRICTAAVAAQGKVCQGEDFEMFRIENMDPGSLYRYIGPVSSLSKKTIDLINGPAVINPAPALGTCTNGSCVARPPFFYQAVVIGKYQLVGPPLKKKLFPV